MIKDKDLIEGEFYYSKDFSGTKDNNFILKYFEEYNSIYIPDTMNTRLPKILESEGNFNENVTRLATPEEQHWLEVCIANNRYFEYTDAMKTYVKPINPKTTVSDLTEILTKLLKL